MFPLIQPPSPPVCLSLYFDGPPSSLSVNIIIECPLSVHSLFKKEWSFEQTLKHRL